VCIDFFLYIISTGAGIGLFVGPFGYDSHWGNLLHTTTEKITKRFQSIKNAEIDRLNTDESLKIDIKDEEETNENIFS